MIKKFKTLNGGTITRNISKYCIDWDSKSLGRSKYGKFQTSVKDFLSQFWRRQDVYEEIVCFGTSFGGGRNLRLDFLNLTREIAIEVMGIQHEEFGYFHKGDRQKWLKQIEADDRKREWCIANDFQLIYIFPEEELSVELFKKKGIIL